MERILLAEGRAMTREDIQAIAAMELKIAQLESLCCTLTNERDEARRMCGIYKGQVMRFAGLLIQDSDLFSEDDVKKAINP